MDLLYSRYASPFEFMNLYINGGRFGEFVSEILEMDFKRKKEEIEKENDDRLWSLYIRSMSDKSFVEWKKDLNISTKHGASESGRPSGDGPLTDDDIKAMIQNSQSILNNFVPD